jgi:hypothetical protein
MLASFLFHDVLASSRVDNLQLLTVVLASVFGGVSGYLASRVCYAAAPILFVLSDSYSGVYECTQRCGEF